MENPYRPVSMHPLLDCSMIPSENLSTDKITDPRSNSMEVSTTNISKNLGVHTNCFPSSADWDRVENKPYFMPSDSREMEDCSMTKRYQMDCCVGVEADVLVVSKRQLSFRFPSPDSCLQLGLANSEDFWSPNEYCVGAENLREEELNYNGKGSLDELEVETSIHGESSTDSSWCEEFTYFDQSQVNPQASQDITRPLGNQPDYLLDYILDQTDDIFLRSIPEESSPAVENPYRLVSMHPLLDCSMIPSENLSTDMITESKSTSTDVSTTNISNNLSVHTNWFPSSVDWDRVENTPHFMLSDSEEMEDCSRTKEPVIPGLIPDEINSLHKVDRHSNAGESLEESVLQDLKVAIAHVKFTTSIRLCFRDTLYRLAKASKQPHIVPDLIPDELNSPHKVARHSNAGGCVEESVLQELAVAMAQLTKNTRLCFRDALYHLAKDSEKPHVVSQTQSGAITMETQDSLSTAHFKTPRFGMVNPIDYQNNAIEWTVGKLMFDKLDCDTNDISSAALVNLSKETVMTDAPPNYG